MATIDLADLVPDLEGALTIPGATSKYADASEDEWITKLKNAFWSAYNDGLITGFTCDEDGAVSPVSGDGTFGRDQQQICIMYAAINVLQNELLQIKTAFRAKAGSVEYETQQSAQVLKGLLDSLFQQKAFVLKRLSDMGTVDSFYIDGVQNRDNAIRSGLITWTG